VQVAASGQLLFVAEPAVGLHPCTAAFGERQTRSLYREITACAGTTSKATHPGLSAGFSPRSSKKVGTRRPALSVCWRRGQAARRKDVSRRCADRPRTAAGRRLFSLKKIWLPLLVRLGPQSAQATPPRLPVVITTLRRSAVARQEARDKLEANALVAGA
jgi:hypothetical protein